MSEKVYLNGIIIKEKVFDDGGTILKVSIKADDLKEEIDKHKNADGWVNVEIKKRREVSDTGVSHYTQLNTYKKEESFSQGSNAGKKANDTDDLPF